MRPGKKRSLSFWNKGKKIKISIARWLEKKKLQRGKKNNNKNKDIIRDFDHQSVYKTK